MSYPYNIPPTWTWFIAVAYPLVLLFVVLAAYYWNGEHGDHGDH